MSDAPDRPLRIGVSTCLLGEKVRWDAGHKHDRFLTDVLGPFVEWVPVCPEVELGLGIPREPIRLVRETNGVGLVGVKSGTDHTAAMRAYALGRVARLDAEDLSGYVLNKGSPSCGLERVPVHAARGGPPSRSGRGLFADALVERFPKLPVEEEGRLTDARLRENWVERIFAYRRVRDFFGGCWTAGGLVRFHTAEELSLLAHSPAAYRDLGRLVAGAGELPRAALRTRYVAGFMSALEILATRPRHANVLSHALGYFRRDLDDPSRRELLGLVDDYRRGFVPLVVPVTLLRHHARRLGVEYLLGQVYLDSHPKELALRNHV
jgi:uncharacterized protein YbgA (DUF1722 family)/uncharacterized protein YbbK (DUF523 family)